MAESRLTAGQFQSARAGENIPPARASAVAALVELPLSGWFGLQGSPLPRPAWPRPHRAAADSARQVRRLRRGRRFALRRLAPQYCRRGFGLAGAIGGIGGHYAARGPRILDSTFGTATGRLSGTAWRFMAWLCLGSMAPVASHARL